MFFTSRSKYDKVRDELLETKTSLNNTTIDLIREKRKSYELSLMCRDLLDQLKDEKTRNSHNINNSNSNSQFSKNEIKTLIMLCHPDKHDHSVKAKDITAKLLEMR